MIVAGVWVLAALILIRRRAPALFMFLCLVVLLAQFPFTPLPLPYWMREKLIRLGWLRDNDKAKDLEIEP